MSTITRSKAESVARRLQMQRLTKWLLWSLFAAGVLNLILVLAAKLELIVLYLEVNLGILGTALIFGVFKGLSRKRTAFEAARIADSRLGLKERIASALELERDPARKAIYDLQARDADRHAAQIDIRRAFPHRFTREAKLALAVGLAVAVAAFLPRYPLFQSGQERAEKTQIKEQGAKVVQLAKRLQIVNKESDKPRDQLSLDLEDFGEQMQKGRVSKKAALSGLNKFTKEIEAEHRALADQNTTKSYDQALAELKAGEAELPELPEDMKGLSGLEEASLLSESLEKKDFDAASGALEQLSKELGKLKLSPEQLEQLMKRLASLAQAFKDTDLDKFAKLLEKVLENIDLRHLELSAEDLEKAAELLKELGQDMLTQEQLQRLARLLEESKQQIAMSGLAGTAGAQEAGSQGGSEWGKGPGGEVERRTESVPRETMDPTRVPGQRTPGEAAAIPDKGAPGAEEGSAPFYEAYGEYRKAAEDELHREEIPAAFRKQIKDYFESITPTESSGDDKETRKEKKDE